MDAEPTGTKEALLLAAGELFAERGLAGTSVRAIARKAGANLAAVNYHFGSKENLYTEALRYVIRGHQREPLRNLVPDDATGLSRQELSNVLADIIRTRFADLMFSGRPAWRTVLAFRAIQSSSPALAALIDEDLGPDSRALCRFFRQFMPAVTEQEASLWALSLVGEGSFYLLARAAILMLLGKEKYDEDFIDAACRHAIERTIRALGLPEPEASFMKVRTRS